MPTTDLPTDPRAFLAASLRRRVPTWRVAEAATDLLVDGPSELRQAVPGGRHRLLLDRYWMGDDFDRVADARRQVSSFWALFPGAETPARYGVDPEPVHVRALVEAGMEVLGYSSGASARDALRSGARRTHAVRKRVRLLARMEDKADRIEAQARLRRAQMQAKSRLAYAVDPDRCDDLTLALVAYVAARANRRSVFQVGPQSRMRDEAVDALLEVAEARPGTAWDQVALVMPTPPVLARLAPGELGVLLGRCHDAMADAADALGGLWPTLPGRMRAEMVMVKGVDSSRWNAFAGAFNTMRSAWIAGLEAAGMEGVLDAYCPGKAPRLMASDVAWMYRDMGLDLHADTTLFGALPHPWDVVAGRRGCDRFQIEAAAAQHGVDPDGWTGPRRAQAAERTEPEPALVHGVVVADPRLADTLRRCGAFSAKAVREAGLPDVVRGVRADGERLIPTVEGVAERERA